MRVAAKIEGAEKTYVFLSDKDQIETDNHFGIVSRLDDRVQFNVNALTPQEFGVVVTNLSEQKTLYPWHTILWVDGF